jgi:hypothetical protein
LYMEKKGTKYSWTVAVTSTTTRRIWLVATFNEPNLLWFGIAKGVGSWDLKDRGIIIFRITSYFENNFMF